MRIRNNVLYALPLYFDQLREPVNSAQIWYHVGELPGSAWRNLKGGNINYREPIMQARCKEARHRQLY